MLFAAAQLVDLVSPVAPILGVRRVRIKASAEPLLRLAFDPDLPLTHSDVLPA
jgi:hypothetical protein